MDFDKICSRYDFRKLTHGFWDFQKNRSKIPLTLGLHWEIWEIRRKSDIDRTVYSFHFEMWISRADRKVIGIPGRWLQLGSRAVVCESLSGFWPHMSELWLFSGGPLEKMRPPPLDSPLWPLFRGGGSIYWGFGYIYFQTFITVLRLSKFQKNKMPRCRGDRALSKSDEFFRENIHLFHFSKKVSLKSREKNEGKFAKSLSHTLSSFENPTPPSFRARSKTPSNHVFLGESVKPLQDWPKYWAGR